MDVLWKVRLKFIDYPTDIRRIDENIQPNVIMKNRTVNSYQIFTFITRIHGVAVVDLNYSRFRIVLHTYPHNNRVNNHLIPKSKLFNPFFFD